MATYQDIQNEVNALSGLVSDQAAKAAAASTAQAAAAAATSASSTATAVLNAAIAQLQADLQTLTR